MKPLHSKHSRNNISPSTGKANFCRLKLGLIQKNSTSSYKKSSIDPRESKIKDNSQEAEILKLRSRYFASSYADAVSYTNITAKAAQSGWGVMLILTIFLPSVKVLIVQWSRNLRIS